MGCAQVHPGLKRLGVAAFRVQQTNRERFALHHSRPPGLQPAAHHAEPLRWHERLPSLVLHVHEHLTILSTLAGKAPLARGKVLLANVQKACRGPNTVPTTQDF
jgi:hypothetical protein